MRVAVVGGGISGLAAAYRLRTLLGQAADIVVVEASGELGGKLRTVPLAGGPVDAGAEAFLVRRPEALALAGELGLEAELRHPGAARAQVRAGAATVPLPAPTLMGIPAGPEAVAGAVSAGGLAAIRAEATLPVPSLPGRDRSLGGLLRERFGDELVDRVVDPLLGGVYAGGADGLGVRAVLPALAAALDAGAPSVSAAVAGLLGEQADTSPVFGTVRGGLGVLVDRLVERSGAAIHLGLPATGLQRSAGGWSLRLGADSGAAQPGHLEPGGFDPGGFDPGAVELGGFDGVVLAVPPPAARKLLSGHATDAAAAFAHMRLASMAVVGLAFPATVRLPEASGVLIGATETHADGRAFTAKAFTYLSMKWPHYAEQGTLVRGSVGRFGDQEGLRHGDAELLRRVRADLAEVSGIDAAPAASFVQRWGGALPQYAPGHAERVARIERAVAEAGGLAVAGAALHGVGIPACIGSGDAAARGLVAAARG